MSPPLHNDANIMWANISMPGVQYEVVADLRVTTVGMSSVGLLYSS